MNSVCPRLDHSSANIVDQQRKQTITAFQKQNGLYLKDIN